MRRRAFIEGIAALAAALWPLAARAQLSALPKVGFLRSSTLADVPDWVTAFRQGLKEAGFVEGQNVAIEFRTADNQPDRLPVLVTDLIHQPVTVIVGNTESALAAKAATHDGADRLRDWERPGQRRPRGQPQPAPAATSPASPFSPPWSGRSRLELLRQMVPTIIAMLVNPNIPLTEAERRDVQTAAQAIGQQLVFVDVSNERDIETAFATSVQQGAGALLVGTGGFLNSKREQIVALADRYALPTSYSQREGVVSGGLMSYGANITDAYRQVGIYVARILEGERPSDLPVMQSTKFDFVINLKTAKALGLNVPPTLLATATEVIE
jgi:putative ABC transport system substrate-binding protein